jgi:hypothetical protein
MSDKEITDAVVTIEKLIGSLEERRDALQTRYNDMSEAAQEGSRGEALSEKIAQLEDALTSLENAKDVLDATLDQ